MGACMCVCACVSKYVAFPEVPITLTTLFNPLKLLYIYWTDETVFSHCS